MFTPILRHRGHSNSQTSPNLSHILQAENRSKEHFTRKKKLAMGDSNKAMAISNSYNKAKGTETMETHISFLYSIASTHCVTATSSREEMESRDDIDYYNNGSSSWDAISGEVREEDSLRDGLKQRKSNQIFSVHNIGKALKKPWKKISRKSDKVPLISQVQRVSSRTVARWDAILPHLDNDRSKVYRELKSDSQLL